MILKEGVTQAGTKPPTWWACGIAEMIYRYEGLQLVITSLTDSHEDRPESLHNKGLAVDFRTKNIYHGVVVSIHKQLVTILNPLGYDVVLYVAPDIPHIHCEYHPKSAENWQRFDRPLPRKDDFVV